MKKIFLAGLALCLSQFIFAQDTLTVVDPASVNDEKINLTGRPNDHLLIQFGYNGWQTKTDTMGNGGFSHTFNAYFMFDFPFKSNPKLSVAIGPGIGSDHVIFDERYVAIKDNNTQLHFVDQSDTTHFKKTKLALTYLEAPVELRFTSKPMQNAKSFKMAIGVKVGTMLNAHTRNRTLQDANDNTLNSYTMKESSKKYFNTTRIAGTLRVGIGHITAFGSYQFTNLFKEGVAPQTNPYSIGISLGGL